MIIPTYQRVLDGDQTQLRIVFKPGEYYCAPLGAICRHRDDTNDYVGYTIDKTYAVQPHFGQKAVARIRITSIRQERVQDISEDDCIAEGLNHDSHYCFICNGSGEICGDHASGWGCDPCAVCHGTGWKRDPIKSYAKLWDSIHTKHGERWIDNPACWVLEFELAREAVSA